MTTEPANRAASLAALLPLVRYGRRYLGRAAGGAGGADDVLRGDARGAVRSALDDRLRLFERERRHDQRLFHGHGGARRRHRARRRDPLLSGDDARRARGRRSETGRVRASVAPRRLVLRQRADRRTRVAPHRRHDADQGGVRLFGVDRAPQSVHVRRRDRAHGLYEPETVGFGAGRDSGHRRAAHRLGARGAPAGRGAPRTRSPKRPLSLRESLGAARTMQAFGAESASQARFADEVESAYGAARDAAATRSLLIAVAVSLAFCSVVFVLWLGARDVLAGRMSGGLLSQFVLFAVLAATSLGELSQVWNEVSAAAGSAGRIAELLAVEATHRRAGPAGAHAFAAARRDRIQACRLRLSERARRSCSGRFELFDRAGRTGRHRRRLRGRQVDHIPAHHALLRRRRRARSWSTASM